MRPHVESADCWCNPDPSAIGWLHYVVVPGICPTCGALLHQGHTDKDCQRILSVMRND